MLKKSLFKNGQHLFYEKVIKPNMKKIYIRRFVMAAGVYKLTKRLLSFFANIKNISC